MTTRQTVNGVDNKSPGSPQISVQKIAAMRIASGERPTCVPYNSGSTKFDTINSKTKKTPTVASASLQPLNTASDSKIGINAAIGGPTYGRNRRTEGVTPQSAAFGIPIKCNAIPMAIPYVKLTANWSNKYRLIRRVASSSACVITCNRPLPASRINRFRRSSLPIKMKIVNIAIIPARTTGPSTFSTYSSALVGGTTSTAIGVEGEDAGGGCFFVFWFAAGDPGVAASASLASS